MATFHLERDARNQFRFVLKCEDHGDLLRDTMGHATEQACRACLKEVRLAVLDDARIAKHDWPTYFFTVKSSAGVPIGISAAYPDAQERDEAIGQMKHAVAAAAVLG